MKALICLALVALIAISMSQTKTNTSSLGLSLLGYDQDNKYQSSGLRSLYNNWALHASNSTLLPEPTIISQINQAQPDSHQKLVSGSPHYPIFGAQEYPQNVNLMPTPGQYAQLIKRYASDVANEVPPNESMDDVKYAINFYLLICTLMKYFTDVQQLVSIQVIQTEHAPINAAFEMVQDLKQSFENILRNLKRIQFEEHTYKTHPDSSAVKHILLGIISQVIMDQGGIKGSDGILELYQLGIHPHTDHNTKIIIDNLRAIFQSCATINAKAMGLMRQSTNYLEKPNKNILKRVTNDTMLERVRIGNPMQHTSTNSLTLQTYAKLIDIQTAIISEKPSKSQINTYFEVILFENNLATGIKMLDDIQRVISKLVIKSNLAPYIAVIDLLKEATNIFEKGKTIMRSCQIIPREDMVNYENSNDQSNDYKTRYASYWNRCGNILKDLKQQLIRTQLALGKSEFILEASQISHIHHDDYNSNKAIDELLAYMISAQMIIIKVKSLIDESLSLIDH